MTNIFFKKAKIINNINNINKKKINIRDENSIRNFPAANIEWYNSIYAYNRNYEKILPSYDKMVSKLIKSYFNLYNPKYKNKRLKISMTKRMWTLLRRRSTNRILISKAEIKHTNTKSIVTIYIYNAEKRYLLKKLKNIEYSLLLYNNIKKKKKLEKKNIKNKKKQKKLLIIKPNKLLEKIKSKTYNILKIYKKDFLFFLKKTNSNNIYKYFLIQEYKIIIKKILKNFLRKEKLILYYNYLLWLNKSKFENTYIYILNKLIKKFYKKKIEFNLVNLKYLYLNSNILTECIAVKLRNRKNRLLRVLYNSLYKVKLPILNKNSETYINITDKKKLSILDINNFKLFNKLSALNLSIINNNIQKKDFLEKFLQDKYLYIKPNKKNFFFINTVLNSIKGKAISGIRIEASGRLTRRLIAARSISRFVYKGTLKNIDSSYKGLPSVMLRGNIKSNLDYIKISSKTRIGSFGLKGWINTL